MPAGSTDRRQMEHCMARALLAKSMVKDALSMRYSLKNIIVTSMKRTKSTKNFDMKLSEANEGEKAILSIHLYEFVFAIYQKI